MHLHFLCVCLSANKSDREVKISDKLLYILWKQAARQGDPANAPAEG